MSSTLESIAGKGPISSLTSLAALAEGIVRGVAQPDMVQAILRIALAVPFWRSGILKWDGFLQLNETAVDLFTQEFMLHLPGGPYPYPAPAAMAFLSGCGEILFPILLVLGLATRFAALGLLLMTIVVELTVPDGWPIHITWAAMALATMRYGPGRLSLDYLIARIAGTTNP
ncbi:DoxX family protein [Rhizobium cauense]|uniref:DoxX family protein n=1 Tax=Rhizobium cauense TaxID=1166683 RepID=UPI001C6ED5B7|nr:DoxX family protein [Rhizobium cauense]MBW9118073.1 DoxX family protein [Rhizobium cauense]